MNCLACQNNQISSKEYKVSQNSLGFELINVCQSCQFAWVNTKLTQSDLDTFYNEGHYWDSDKSSKSHSLHNLIQAHYRVLYVKQFLNQSKQATLKVLDVGSGMGFIAKGLQKYLDNFEYYYQESDPNMHTIIKSHSPMAKDAALNNQDFKYDLIFLNHVLEHVIDPRNFLQYITEKLSPDGVLYIEVPNRDDLFKSDVFPHTLFFKLKNLEEVIKSSGLKIIDSKTFGKSPSQKNSLMTKIISKLFTISANKDWIYAGKILGNFLFAYSTKNENGIWNSALVQID